MSKLTKKISTIGTVLALFGASLYVAYLQGNVAATAALRPAAGTLENIPASSVAYSGFTGFFAAQFSKVLNVLMNITGNNLMLALVVLALVVEVILLYPAVRIQLKQKKIHWFHKKLVDRFERGEIALSATKQELHKLYEVNEKIHSRGALLVVAQMIVLLSVLAGLNLLIHAQYLVPGISAAQNAALLAVPAGTTLPILAGLLYTFHSLVKIVIKEREDYISPTQTTAALVFAVMGSALVYFFAQIFPAALTVYAVTLMAFATIRTLVVEDHAKAWGKLAYEDLLNMLRHSKPHSDRFEYLSRKWNHLPIVRHINFHLLEEALSMSLGLLVALNILGVFQGQPGFAQEVNYVNCGDTYSSMANNIADNAVGYPSTWTAGQIYWAFKGVTSGPSVAEYELYVKRDAGNTTPLDNTYCMSSERSKTANNPTEQIAISHQIQGMTGVACQAFPSTTAAFHTKLCGGTCDSNTQFILVQCFYRVARVGGVLNVSECPANLTAGTQNQVPNVTGGTPPGEYKFEVLGTYQRTLGGATYIPVKGDTGIRVYDALNLSNYNDTCTFASTVTGDLECPNTLEVIAERSQASLLKKATASTRSMDVVPGATYRLRLKNNNVDNVTDYTLVDSSAFVQEIKKDPTDPDVIEVKIKSNATGTSSATLTIKDPTSDNACALTFTLNLKGGAGQGTLKPAGPTKL